jgi:S-DNA-T family DNA segregation ATPase FtsK/SpoIIIE
MQSAPQYNEEIISQPVQLNGKGGVVMDFATDTSGDHTYQEALRIVVNSGKASASLLQRRLGIGYAKAARYIDTMEEQGIVGQSTGNSKPRDVLISSMDELGDDSDSEKELG